MSASLFRRLSALFGSTPDQGPKAAKFAVLTPGHAGFPNRAKRSEGSDTTPSKTPRVSPCKPLCAILLAKASVYPLSPVKTNVSRLCECDLKPLRRGLSHAVWDVASAVWAVIGGKQGSPPKPSEAGSVGRGTSGMSEFSPLLAETSDMELAPTKSRIKGWRRNRRSAHHFCPQCGQLTRVSAQAVVASIRKIFCTIGV